MENILNYGLYTIAGKGNIAMHSIHDVIQLILLIPKDKKEVILITKYSLDDLRDLESKLVLITGSKAENRAAVEHFLDVCSCSYACVFLKFQFFLTDTSLCVPDCRGADKTTAGGQCAIHWVENAVPLSATSC